MFLRNFCLLLALANLAISSPLTAREDIALAKRGAVLTAQYATETEDNGRFILGNNLWGMAASPGGSQSTQVTAVNNDAITWYTSYNWGGSRTQVKSYANLSLRSGLNKALSSITSIPTTWDWTYTSASSGLIADVSYDLWLSNQPGSTGATSASTYEIMIWLSTRGGAQPAGSQIGTASINGQTWQVWKGNVGNWIDFSFVAPSETNNYSADLLPFFTYLIDQQGVPASQYFVQAQSGTEAFVGNATVTTNSFTMSIN